MTDRPLITFVLLAYNQEKLIEEAIQGAFAQTYSPLEIILSDDCSMDETFAIMEEMVAGYCGPHKVILNRNERNLGIVPHFNRLCEIARGKLIVLAAGDDISLPERTCVLFDTWKKYCGSVVLIMSEYAEMDSEGVVTRANASRFQCHGIEKRAIVDCIEHGAPHGASMMFSSELLQNLGPIHAHVEDVTLFFRALLLGKVYYHKSVLLKVRVHESFSKNKNPSIFSKKLKLWYESIGIQLRNDICRLQEIDNTQIFHQHAEEIIKAFENKLFYIINQCNLYNSNILGRFTAWLYIARKRGVKKSIILLQHVLPQTVRDLLLVVKNLFS